MVEIRTTRERGKFNFSFTLSFKDAYLELTHLICAFKNLIYILDHHLLNKYLVNSNMCKTMFWM
jgi:hypothetical protein